MFIFITASAKVVFEIFTNFYNHVVQVHYCEEVAQSSPLESLLGLFQIFPQGSFVPAMILNCLCGGKVRSL